MAFSLPDCPITYSQMNFEIMVPGVFGTWVSRVLFFFNFDLTFGSFFFQFNIRLLNTPFLFSRGKYKSLP